MKSIACLLLAAGNSTRFGGRKQLAMIDDQPLITHSLKQLKPLFHDNLFTVLGAYAADIQPCVEQHAQVIHHNGWASGIGSSIAAGVKHISELNNYQAVMIALADQPGLHSSDYLQLWQQFDGERIIASSYGQKAGVPAIFPESCFPQLQALDGDRGARDIIRQHAQQVVTVDLPNAQQDIDTALDLLHYQEHKGDTAKSTL